MGGGSHKSGDILVPLGCTYVGLKHVFSASEFSNPVGLTGMCQLPCFHTDPGRLLTSGTFGWQP